MCFCVSFICLVLPYFRILDVNSITTISQIDNTADYNNPPVLSNLKRIKTDSNGNQKRQDNSNGEHYQDEHNSMCNIQHRNQGKSPASTVLETRFDENILPTAVHASPLSSIAIDVSSETIQTKQMLFIDTGVVSGQRVWAHI